VHDPRGVRPQQTRCPSNNGRPFGLTVSCCFRYGAQIGISAFAKCAFWPHRRPSDMIADDPTSTVCDPRALASDATAECSRRIPRSSARARAARRRGRVQSTPSRPTVGVSIRRFCLACLGASSARGAFDCGSKVCPLRPASPFRGKPMAESFQGPSDPGEPPPVPKRRPSRKLIHAQCRQCQPGDITDCMATDCALYPYRPWEGPGKIPGRRPSRKQLAHLESARRLSAAARRPATPIQKPTTAVGQAFDA